MSNLQAHFLDSVAEDQESSNTKAFEEETLTPLPMPSNGLAVPLGAAESSRPTPMPGRKLSFSRRPSFGLPALAAQHHASSQSLSGGSASRINLASSAHSLGLSQQLLQKESASLKPETGTLKPEMDPSSSASSRKGVINMDEKPETPKAAIMSSPKETTKDALEASRQRHSKKYNLPVSDRFFIAKNPKGMNACVGCYDPYPISWPTKQDVKNQRALAKKKDVDDWNKMVDRFPDKKPTHPLGPGTYQPSFDYVQTHGILNVGGVSFKSTDDRFRKAFKAVEGNPNVGPGVYAVEIQKHRSGFVPWVKDIKVSLGRVVNSKDPITPTTQLQLLKDSLKLEVIPSFAEAQKLRIETKKQVDPEPERKETKLLHHLDMSYIINPKEIALRRI